MTSPDQEIDVRIEEGPFGADEVGRAILAERERHVARLVGVAPGGVDDGHGGGARIDPPTELACDEIGGDGAADPTTNTTT